MQTLDATRCWTKCCFFFIRYRFSFAFLYRSVLIINRGERTRTVLSDLYFPINSRHSTYTPCVRFVLFVAFAAYFIGVSRGAGHCSLNAQHCRLTFCFLLCVMVVFFFFITGQGETLLEMLEKQAS